MGESNEDKAGIYEAVSRGLYHQYLMYKKGVLGGGVAVATYTISGTVYDADGSTPVSGVTVAIGANSTTSAANGTYSITGLAAGTNGNLTCTLAGYSWTAISVSAMAADLTGQNFTNLWYAAGGSLAACVRAYKPLGAANLAASYVNLVNPGTGDASLGTAPTFNAATGWTFNGTSQYLKTGYIPGNNDSVVIAYNKLSDLTATIQALFGSINSGKWFTVYGPSTYSGYGNRMASPVQFSPAGSLPDSGVAVIVPGKGYMNGELRGDNTQADQTYRELFIGAMNNNGAADLFAAENVAYMAIYNNLTLSTTQINIFSDALLASGTAFMPYGDSKSVCTTVGNWPNQIATGAARKEYPYRIAAGGRTVATAQAAVDTELATKRGTATHILWNLGVNDAAGLPAEAT